jgi:hypothetical protein
MEAHTSLAAEKEMDSKSFYVYIRISDNDRDGGQYLPPLRFGWNLNSTENIELYIMRRTHTQAHTESERVYRLVVVRELRMTGWEVES